MSYSIFIPHLSKEINIEHMKIELGHHILGEINKIDIIKSHHKWNHFFIHYSTWNILNPIARDIKDKLDNGHACSLYIVSSNTYWKILKNTSIKHKTINKNPFEINISTPTLLRDNRITSSLFNNMSLFDRIIGDDTEEHNTTTSNNRLDELEKRIKKIEEFLYYHTN